MLALFSLLLAHLNKHNHQQGRFHQSLCSIIVCVVAARRCAGSPTIGCTISGTTHVVMHTDKPDALIFFSGPFSFASVLSGSVVGF